MAKAEAACHSRVTARDPARRQLDLMRALVERGIEPRLMQLQSAASVAAGNAVQAKARE